MAPSDSRSVNRCDHGHLACKFPINVTVPFYIMFDNSMKGQKGACSVMTTKSTDAKYKMMGEYKSQADADAAMKTMKECG